MGQLGHLKKAVNARLYPDEGFFEVTIDVDALQRHPVADRIIGRMVKPRTKPTPAEQPKGVIVVDEPTVPSPVRIPWPESFRRKVAANEPPRMSFWSDIYCRRRPAPLVLTDQRQAREFASQAMWEIVHAAVQSTIPESARSDRSRLTDGAASHPEESQVMDNEKTITLEETMMRAAVKLQERGYEVADSFITNDAYMHDRGVARPNPDTLAGSEPGRSVLAVQGHEFDEQRCKEMIEMTHGNATLTESIANWLADHVAGLVGPPVAQSVSSTPTKAIIKNGLELLHIRGKDVRYILGDDGEIHGISVGSRTFTEKECAEMVGKGDKAKAPAVVLADAIEATLAMFAEGSGG